MFCPKCGAKLPDNAKFCGVCGAQLGGATAAPAGPSPTASVSSSRKKLSTSHKKYLVPIAAVVLIVVIAVVAGFPTNWFGLTGDADSGTPSAAQDSYDEPCREGVLSINGGSQTRYTVDGDEASFTMDGTTISGTIADSFDDMGSDVYTLSDLEVDDDGLLDDGQELVYASVVAPRTPDEYSGPEGKWGATFIVKDSDGTYTGSSNVNVFEGSHSDGDYTMYSTGDDGFSSLEDCLDAVNLLSGSSSAMDNASDATGSWEADDSDELVYHITAGSGSSMFWIYNEK